MNNLQLFEQVADCTSKLVTQQYSTSFYTASLLFPKDIRQHIFNIYGFVRFADEIVDTFHCYDKALLIGQFERNYRETLESGISLNPVLHSFCRTLREKKIPLELVEAFLHSMKMDLDEIRDLDQSKYQEYIYGSAEVVGLMCLKTFVNTDEEYEKLKVYAQSLGAAFQKINFLRDISADFTELNRTYFPKVDFRNFSEADKHQIEAEIAQDFAHALEGIKMLPLSSRIAVYTAYKYYIQLFKKIRQSHHTALMSSRIRISNASKMYLVSKVIVRKQLNCI